MEGSDLLAGGPIVRQMKCSDWSPSGALVGKMEGSDLSEGKTIVQQMEGSDWSAGGPRR